MTRVEDSNLDRVNFHLFPLTISCSVLLPTSHVSASLHARVARPHPFFFLRVALAVYAVDDCAPYKQRTSVQCTRVYRPSLIYIDVLTWSQVICQCLSKDTCHCTGYTLHHHHHHGLQYIPRYQTSLQYLVHTNQHRRRYSTRSRPDTPTDQP